MRASSSRHCLALVVADAEGPLKVLVGGGCPRVCWHLGDVEALMMATP